MPPLIGITPSRFKLKQKFPCIYAQEKYTQAVQDAGGLPVLIPLTLTLPQVEAMAERLDGVLFSGGGDMHPRHYGRTPNHLSGRVIEDRDLLELRLIQAMKDAGKPFLGICRGCQMVNVAQGGSLYIDIQDEMPGSIKHDYSFDEDRDLLSHTVRVQEGSLLSSILETEETPVNSIHHQGICGLGKGLKSVAWAPEGLVEAVELADHPFGLAVQWHPEWLQAHEPMRNLFRAFVRAAQE